MSPPRLSLLFICVYAFLLALSGRAETITLHSGNGAVGGLDSKVHFLAGPQAGGFERQFTAADFEAARTGPAAQIMAPYIYTTLGGPGDAQWIATDPNINATGTALYAIDFDLTDPFDAADLELRYRSDYFPGDAINPPLYLNGAAVFSALPPALTSDAIYRTRAAGAFLHPGRNTLYFEVSNDGGPGGAIFQVSIVTGKRVQLAGLSSYAALPSSQITLAGQNFDAAVPANNHVRFNEVAATVLSATATTLVARVPTGVSAGKVEVAVGGFIARSARSFRPVQNKVEPIDGNALGLAFENPSMPRCQLADLDGDGRADVIDCTLTVYRNVATPGGLSESSFEPGVRIGLSADEFKLVDLDGDGRLDVVAGCPGHGGICVWQNTSTPGQISFSEPYLPLLAEGDQCFDVFVGDADGDGQMDVGGRGYFGYLPLFHNVTVPGGELAFERLSFPEVGGAWGVAFGDLNGDGKDDLAVRRYDPSNILVNDVTVYRAGVLNGAPVFTEAAHIAVKGEGGIAVEDLDGDGRPDLVFDSFTVHDGNAHPAPGALVTAVRNVSTQSGISFATPQVIQLQNGTGETYAPLVTDLNGDGRPEIVVATEKGIADIPVLAVSGGGFALGAPAYVRADLYLGSPLVHDESAENLRAGDLDGDGRVDLIFTNWNGSYFFRNTLAPVPVITGFSQDVAPTGTVLTISGQNFGATPEGNVVRFGNVRAVVLEASATALKVVVPAGAGDAAVTVTVPATSLSATSPADFRTAYASSRTIDSTTFAAPVAFGMPFGTGDGFVIDAAVGDFDADGKPDVVILSAAGNNPRLVLLRNASESPGANLTSASLVSAGEVALSSRPQRVRAADLDGDGHLDLAVACEGKVSIYRGLPSGGPLTPQRFAARADFPTGLQSVGGFEIHDLDLDGHPDLMVGDANNRSLTVLRNTSLGDTLAFGGPQSFLSDQFFNEFAVGDLDGDGFADVATAGSAGRFFRNKSARGHIEMTSVPNMAFGFEPAAVRLVDLDGDHRPEIVFADPYQHAVGVLRNTPRAGVFDNSLFAPMFTLPTTDPTHFLAVADLDGDGAPEIAAATGGAPGVVSVFRNLGGGGPLRAASFAARVDFPSGLGEGPMLTVDLDGDGKPELISPNGADGTLSILQNRLAVPSAAFFFSAPSFSAGEGDGGINVTVQRNFTAPASVNYSTSAGSAVASGDFTPASGLLSFAQGELNKTIRVPIIEDSIYEGDESFQMSLSGAPAGSVILAPGQARLMIIDNDAFGPTPSVTDIRPPDPEPGTRGQLSVALAPPEAAGQWRLLGETAWRDGGTTVQFLLPGNYLVEYRPVAGYERPEPSTVVIAGNDDAQVNEFYDAHAGSPTGNLNVSIQPETIAHEAVEGDRGQWRELGTGTWHDSGDLLAGLPVGPHLIEFKPVAGRATPPHQSVLVSSGATTASTGIYYLAEPGIGAPVTQIDSTTARTAEPYVYMGQIQTDIGAGSGFVVLDRTVLTAAHVLFDDVMLTYAPGARWYWQRTPGQQQAPPLVPRGVYVFDGYAAQRNLDHALPNPVPPGTSTPASQNLDVAAIYFEEPAARNGFGGFIRSDSEQNEWLQSTRAKILAGYPVEGAAPTALGQLHASAAINDAFDFRYSRIYRTDKIRGFPGCSGGPLLVLLDNGRYYPAGIYLGGTGQTLIRAIDSTVVDLINRAQDSANSGDNNTGGGFLQVNSALGSLGDVAGTLNFQLYPTAVNATARWSLTSEPGVLRKSGQARRALPGGKYTITFVEVPGFSKPADREVQVGIGTYVFNANYLALAKPIITSAATARATIGLPFTFQVVSENGADSFKASGLPGGLRMDLTGKITGKPTSAGTFAVTIRAHNAAGDTVTPLQVTISPPGELLVSVMGGGTVSPGFIGLSKRMQGKSLTITATPARGFVFAGYTGGLTASTAKLTFAMPERLELVANFIPSPFSATAGSYFGLATRTEAAGTVAFTGSASGAFTMACKINGQTYSFRSALAIDGSFAGASMAGSKPASANLQLDLAGLGGLTGSLTAGGKLYAVQAYARGFDAVSNPATAFQGRYTVAFEPVSTGATVPQGIGTGTATVDAGGNVTFSGLLGDGTKVPPQKAPLSKDGIWPLFVPAYASKGSIAGFAAISEATTSNELTGTLNWNKPVTAANLPYPAAFTSGIALTGSRYAAPAAGAALLALPNGAARLVIGAFSHDFNLPDASAGPTLQVLGDTTTTPPFTLTFTLANGLFTGNYRLTPDARPLSFNGVVIQGALRARGLTRSADGLTTVPVEVTAQP